ncbi:MAG: hypothetical protein GY807_02805 [Gammaproteobacteria bacterium]|nr:hypothetical protein [Gammaproteobacteria bacterium]
MGAVKILISCGLLLTALAACQAPNAEQQGAQRATDPSRSQPVAAHRSPSKPGASVTLDYDLLTTPVVGQALEIRLTLLPGSSADRLQVTVSAGAGMIIDQGAEPMNRSPVTAGVAAVHTLVVIPQQTGRSYVNVFAAMEHAGMSMMRSFAIPIQVGPVAATQHKPLPIDAQGRPIISMPAVEEP